MGKQIGRVLAESEVSTKRTQIRPVNGSLSPKCWPYDMFIMNDFSISFLIYFVQYYLHRLAEAAAWMDMAA